MHQPEALEGREFKVIFYHLHLSLFFFFFLIFLSLTDFSHWLKILIRITITAIQTSSEQQQQQLQDEEDEEQEQAPAALVSLSSWRLLSSWFSPCLQMSGFQMLSTEDPPSEGTKATKLSWIAPCFIQRNNSPSRATICCFQALLQISWC